MKILFVGVLDVSWSTNVEMKKALETLGHEVHEFNYRTIAKKYSNQISRSRLFKWMVEKPASVFRRFEWLPGLSDLYYRICGRQGMQRLLLKLISTIKYDLIILSKTDSLDYRILQKLNESAPTWYFFMDPMEQAKKIIASAYAKRATFSSATFTEVAEHFEKHYSNAKWITQGIDPDRYSLPERQIEPEYDIVFAGTHTTKRCRIIDAVRQRGIRVTCFGKGWENVPVFGEDLVKIYHRAKIVLNLCRPGSGFSVRVFQVMGSGAFLLSEYCADLEKVFKQGTHLDWFHSEAELLKKITKYLRHSDERKRIARQGAKEVHKRHTWREVMQIGIKMIGV